MKVLIACEESQAVCKAFRAKGHEAYSCDIQECSGGHPEWHIQGDVTPLLNENWDLIIAHPPCTYLSNAGARDFFMKLYNANFPKIAVENPVPSKIYEMPLHSQEIQPYMFGHPFKKK